MEKRKVGNLKQLISAYELELKDGSAYGKKCVLVHNGRLEVMFNAHNALDIAWVKFNGVNVSFLSKNGLNSNEEAFRNKFDGGFLYTCGIDNLSGCVKEKAIHGSLHSKKADNVYYVIDEDVVTVHGKLYCTELFGQNLIFERNYKVYPDKIEINDKVVNAGYTEAEYVALYHTNFGYPFLDSGIEVAFDQKETIAANQKSKDTISDCKTIVEPEDIGSEDLFYHVLNKGEVSLKNNKLKIGCTMRYDTSVFPYLIEWKNLFSGDYVLGIEPSTTRFDEFKKVKISAGESHDLKIDVTFEDL